ncbi:MAG: hypothetical protein GYB65_13810, partial [Chloroflexi bacterium]|nr:hypothetical protein [Chloroflexota bacterium]
MTAYPTALETEVQAWALEQLLPDRMTHVHGVVEAATDLAHRFAPGELAR